MSIDIENAEPIVQDITHPRRKKKRYNAKDDTLVPESDDGNDSSYNMPIDHGPNPRRNRGNMNQT